MKPIKEMDIDEIKVEIAERGYYLELLAIHHHDGSTVWWRWKLYHGENDYRVEIKHASQFKAHLNGLESACAALRWLREKEGK